jgi:hypothetical protein
MMMMKYDYDDDDDDDYDQIYIKTMMIYDYDYIMNFTSIGDSTKDIIMYGEISSATDDDVTVVDASGDNIDYD